MYHLNLPFPKDLHICTLCITSQPLKPNRHLVPSRDGSSSKGQDTWQDQDLPRLPPFPAFVLLTPVSPVVNT